MRLGAHDPRHLGLTQSAGMMVRMEEAAEKLLADVLHRRRWLAQDRDAIAAFLAQVVDAEMKRSRPGGL